MGEAGYPLGDVEVFQFLNEPLEGWERQWESYWAAHELKCKAFLAGLYAGTWTSLDDIKERIKDGKVYTPKMDVDLREKKVRNWKRALDRSRSWAEDYEEE